MPVSVGRAHDVATGETVCGDASAVVTSAQRTLLCVADGLGHGPNAREAADVACAHVVANADKPFEVLLRELDRMLAGTRGAALSLLTLEPADGRVLFAGIGNVELAALSRAHIASPTTPGILGRGFKSVRVWEHPLADGDLFVLTSDGVSNQFDLQSLAHLEPQVIAEAIVARFHRKHDDASCVVARVTLDEVRAVARGGDA
jgi:serine/threonine protein phosphatase PrpC